MSIRAGWVLSTLAVSVMAVAAGAQPREGDTVAFVTVLAGEGATLGAQGPAFSAGVGTFAESTHGVRIGQSVVTKPNGTAVVLMPTYGIVVHIGRDSEVSFATAAGLAEYVPAAVKVIKGRVHVVRKPTDNAWFLVAGGSGVGNGYTLSKGASLIVEVDAGGVSVTATRGAVTFFRGDLPAGALIGADGQPANENGISVAEGQRVSIQAPEVVEDRATPQTAWQRVYDDMFAFGVNHSGQWVEQAEKGDFTPVRSEPTAAGREFGVEVGEARQTFDQPRTTVTTPVSNTPVTATATGQVSTARALLGSQIPSSVLIGQRIRRSRIIGNPGTTGSGQIRFNPNAEQLLLLAGGSGRR